MESIPARSQLYNLGALLFTLIASLFIFFSSSRQSVTVDEPNHLYCGMEYLQYGTYKAWPENPVLSRAVVAIGPYLRGFRLDSISNINNTVGGFYRSSLNLDYFSSGPIHERLAWSRFFVLPLFLLSVFVVWKWSRSLAGAEAAFLAVGMYSTLPALIAHSGLGTTDVTFAATFILSLWLFSKWLEKPKISNATMLGVGVATGLLSKYSMVVFFPIAAATLVVMYWLTSSEKAELLKRSNLVAILRSGTIAVIITFLIVWAFYGFSFGRLAGEPVIAAGMKEGKVAGWIGNLSLPAPGWFAGLKLVSIHYAKGHRSYLFGEISQYGFKSFYPAALLLKTPLTFLLLVLGAFFGIILSPNKKREWQSLSLLIISLLILASLIPSNINLGLRHILVLYPMLAIGGAVLTHSLLTNTSSKLRRIKSSLIIALTIIQLVVCAKAFPNYLSYFNVIGGREPGELLAGSDLDWGQGLFELSEFCKKNKVDTLNLAYYGRAKDCWYDLPPLKFFSGNDHPQGWIAVSEYLYRGVCEGTATADGSCYNLDFRPNADKTSALNFQYRWLDKYPLRGKAANSIRIFYVP
jgi:hypothetical protein